MRMRPVSYWILAAVLVGLGCLSLFSIGAPLLLTGLAMAVVGPWRRRRDVLWPTLTGVWASVLGYLLVAPLGCTGTSTALPTGASTLGRTTCATLLGLDYSGGSAYRAPLLPAFLAGLGVGVVVAVGTRVILERRASTAAAPGG